MAAPGQRVGRAVLELSTDKTQYSAGLQEAQGELTGFSGRAQTTYRNLAQGMAAAGKEASASARMIAGMSAAGRQALAEQQRVANGFLNTGAQLMKATRENAKPVSEMMKAMSLGNANAQASARMIAGMGEAGRKAAEGLNRVNPVLRAMNSAAGAVKGSVGQMVAGFTGANLATRVILGLGEGMRQVVADGQQLTHVSLAFDRLTASIGESRDAMLDAARDGTKGLVKDLDLMLATNKAMLLGLPVTAQEMGKLAQTATSLGRAMGQDATKSLDDLITALGRSSPLILDNLGLTVKLGEANEAYAAKLGKTADELTEAERKTAFYNAAMDAAEKKVAELGDAHLTAMEQIARLGVQIRNNLADTVKSTNESGLLSDALGLLADAYARASKNARDFAEINRRRVQSGGRQDIRSIEELEVVRETERQIEQMKRKLASPLPQPAIGGLNLGGTTRTLEQDIRRLETATGVYTARLARIREELGKLLPEERKQIAAAQALGVSNEDLEKQYHLTEGALRVLNDQTRAGARAANEAASAAKKYADLLGADERAKAADLAKALGTGELQLAKMTEDAQRKVVAALMEGAMWWRATGEIVPASVQKQIDAVTQLRVIPDILKQIREATQETAERVNADFVAAAATQAERASDATLQSFTRRVEADRAAAETSRDLEFERAEFAIEQAKRTGATWQQIDAMEKALAEARLQRTIDQAEEEFRVRTMFIDRTTEFGEAEYQALQRAHDLAIQGMLETHQRAELAKRQELQRTHSLWRRMLDEVRIADRLIDAATRNLFSTFFARTPDNGQAAELKKTADELQKTADIARETYQRMSKDGRVSAEAIHRAWQDMREAEEAASKAHRDAEEAANVRAASKWKAYWDGLKTTFTSILDDMLAYFVRQFIGGLIRSLAGARLAQSLGGFLGGAGGGPGGLFGQGGGIAMNLFGNGGAAASGLFASGGASAGLASGEAINATTAGLAGGGGGGAGMGFLSNPAFWTNPWTIGIAGAITLGMFIWKKGLFRGGWEGIEGNKRRDKFQAQFGGPGTGPDSGFQKIAEFLTQQTGEPGGGRIFRDLQSGDKDRFEAAERTIVEMWNRQNKGRPVQAFISGGLVEGPVGAPVSAVVHGGEGVLNYAAMRSVGMDGLRALNTGRPTFTITAPATTGRASGVMSVAAPKRDSRPIVIENHISMEVRTNDATDFQRVFDTRVVPALNRHLATNGPLVEAIRRSQET